jgi:hypothetical protein
MPQRGGPSSCCIDSSSATASRIAAIVAAAPTSDDLIDALARDRLVDHLTPRTSSATSSGARGLSRWPS